MSETSIEAGRVQRSPEMRASNGVKNFDLKTVLMILAGSSLGESHIATKVREVVEHITGTTPTLDSPDSIEHALSQTVEAVLAQYPELSPLQAEHASTAADIAAWLASDIPEMTIALKPSQTIEQA